MSLEYTYNPYVILLFLTVSTCVANTNTFIITITLFMSQVYLAEHRGPTNWGDRKSNQHKCWFLVRGENRSTRWTTSRSRVENYETHIWRPIRGNRTRATLVEGQCSQYCANTAPFNENWNKKKTTTTTVHCQLNTNAPSSSFYFFIKSPIFENQRR